VRLVRNNISLWAIGLLTVPLPDAGCEHTASTASSRSGRSVELGEAHAVRDHGGAPHQNDRKTK
jgi:hypothetical protein